MKKTVLIIAPHHDSHALAVSQTLEEEFNVNTIIWDSKRFPLHDTANFRLDKKASNLYLRNNGQKISSENLCSIWWRRANKHELDVNLSDPKVYTYCLKQCESFFKGSINCLNIPVINTPMFEIAAEYKPMQLKTAQSIGLSIPNTLMTNDPGEVHDFWKDMNGNIIYKSFNSPSWKLIETRMLTEEDLEHLDTLRHAPIIVQEKIEKGMDIRVNIFGEKIFAASIRPNRLEAQLDWRYEVNSTAKWEEVKLPDDTSTKLVKLLRRLHLHYGCIDLRQQPDGEYVFLEVNPSGQFIFIELDTGQDLTRSFSEFLLNPDVKF